MDLNLENQYHLTGAEAKFEDRRMCLVLKPTEACNFSCDFCSSSYLVNDKTERLPLDKVYAFLKRFPKTEAIFIVGGDPLLMSPDYYKQLIKHVEDNDYPVRISITTNLWDWYKNTEKWNWFLRHPRVEVGTSFQYGDGRRITPTRVFTEDIFIDVFNKFKKEVPNKDLCFLAVIDESNEDKAIDHVRLAKHLNTQCRLVWSNKSGKAASVYPMSKLFKIILELHKLGLTEYEQTALSVGDKMSGLVVACPMERYCDHWMRSLNPDGRYFSCGPLNDDLDVENEIDFKSEVEDGEKYYLPLQKRKDTQYLKEECLSCKMFETCNSCRKHVKDLKDTNKVEEHCTTMKDIMVDLETMSNSEDLHELRRDIDNASVEQRRSFQGLHD
jgi:radical SAM protein with 4Fe4S-binding SPASM domain